MYVSVFTYIVFKKKKASLPPSVVLGGGRILENKLQL